jgi:hypothetical protein
MGSERLREVHGRPRSGGEAMSEAKPVMDRPCEAGARPNNFMGYLQLIKEYSPYVK